MNRAVPAWRSLCRATALLGVWACGAEPRSPTSPPTPTPPVATVYTPGQSYFGRNGYVEYIAGNAPVILTAPHGGTLTPASIPDRTAAACGGSATTVTDLNTAELVRTMQQRRGARWSLSRIVHCVVTISQREGARVRPRK